MLQNAIKTQGQNVYEDCLPGSRGEEKIKQQAFFPPEQQFISVPTGSWSTSLTIAVYHYRWTAAFLFYRLHLHLHLSCCHFCPA